jgi:hypothetical protein
VKAQACMAAIATITEKALCFCGEPVYISGYPCDVQCGLPFFFLEFFFPRFQFSSGFSGEDGLCVSTHIYFSVHLVVDLGLVNVGLVFEV